MRERISREELVRREDKILENPDFRYAGKETIRNKLLKKLKYLESEVEVYESASCR